MREYTPRSLPTPVDLPLFARARADDPETSKEAAAMLEVGSRLALLLDLYRAAGGDGLTDEEAGSRAGFDGAWKRCSDLRKLGLIEPNGRTRLSSTGRRQRVSVIIGQDKK